MVFGKNLPALSLAIVAAVLIPGGTLILLALAPSVPGAMVFAVIFGMGNGLLSIVAGTLPLYLFGSDGYGKLQGKTMASKLVLSALAPFVMASAMANFSIPVSLIVVAILGGAAIVMFGLIFPLQWATRTVLTSG